MGDIFLFCHQSGNYLLSPTEVFLARSCGVAVFCQTPVQSGLKASLISLNMLLSGQEVVFPWYKDNLLA